MNFKRPVYRICAVTRESHLRSDLYRVVRTKDGVYFDSNQNMKGRGVYIKKDLKVIETAYKKKALNRALRCEVKEEVYIALIQQLSKERRD